MRKYIKILSLGIALSLVFCACTLTNDEINDNYKEDNKNDSNIENNENTSEELNDIIGKLYEINDDEIKVFSNGETKSYKINADKVKDFYIGENILLKANETGYDVSLYDQYDFNKRVTEAGDQITRIVGKIKEVGDEFITAVTDDEEIQILNPGDFVLSKDTSAIFDYVVTDKGNQLVNFYDESVKLDLTIKRLTREINGRLLILANNVDNKDYEISVKPETLVNISLSSLKLGDKIAVYPISISDQNPTKVDTNMIIK
ncbi:hypothetical protein JYG23_07145 [Sedimentibacter sp. zth1]|uniref:hypothetical protein n=1 Tax=Sedimentibacter sp. zth1 TaxID=2816908 RepID=UPI001A90D3DA|nr:hypothetical protein [Sedimentibacter sp. zth1]QSX07111.1 hypothetical protein JYG23_07145 [Sedimentibacter sp. zth1]